jgi:hypothetical protein
VYSNVNNGEIVPHLGAIYLRGDSGIGSGGVLNGRDVRQNMILNDCVLDDCILENGLLYCRLLELLEMVLLDLLERELPRPHRLLWIGWLQCRIGNGDIAAAKGLKDQCGVYIGIRSSQSGKLSGMLCHLNAVNVVGVDAGLTSLKLCN